jgi:glyoxylase-like metal-dependent hydrolase (beta-lactamase superfamily II)
MTTNVVFETDKAKIHRVIDIDPFPLPLNVLFPQGTPAQLSAAAERLPKGHVDVAAGTIVLAIQSHLVRFAGKNILIDTCVGEHKPRPLRPDWNARTGTRYLANLGAAGCTPDDIDVVMCTHLHADHLGWNTKLQSGRWVPTFPRARYVMSQREIDQRAREAAQSRQANHGSYQDSVLPVLDAGLVKTAKAGDEIADGASIIDLAGHAPGQIGLELSVAGSHIIFCGDAIHNPVQVLYPDWFSAFCFDAAQAVQTRRMLLRRGASEDLRIVPGHLRGRSMRVAEKNGDFVPFIEA